VICRVVDVNRLVLVVMLVIRHRELLALGTAIHLFNDLDGRHDPPRCVIGAPGGHLRPARGVDRQHGTK
jgi:hypothetical protein